MQADILSTSVNDKQVLTLLQCANVVVDFSIPYSNKRRTGQPELNFLRYSGPPGAFLS